MLAVSIVVLPAASRADGHDSPTAEALFAAGREASERGDYETACARFEESYRLDAAVGTLLNWAACDEDRGKLANAWERYRRLLDLLGKKDPRLELVRARLKKIDERVPRLTLSFATDPPEGSTVSCDGELMTRASLGVPLPMNPGPHEVVVQAIGRKPARFKIALEEKQRLELALSPGEAIPAAPVAAAKRAPSPTPSRPVSRTSETHGTTTKTIGWIALGVGSASLIASGVLGVSYLQHKNTLDDHCPSKQCDSTGLEAVGSLSVLQPAMLVALGAGIVGVGTGIVTLVIASPASKKEAPLAVSLGPTFVTAKYRF